MNAPFYKFGLFGDEMSLVVAFILGIGFGFALERAGFGSARKLTAQFYFTDLAVFKVMFTAIVTAMLGLFYLSWAGFVDVSLVFVNPTYLLPQLVGGLILGVGFVVGGYCPGTSLVGIATGRLDAIVFAVGVAVGILVFGEMYSYLANFMTVTSMGKVTLAQQIGVRTGVVVFGVVVMALLGFWGAGVVERKMAAKGAAA